jgi:hypothetical protein
MRLIPLLSFVVLNLFIFKTAKGSYQLTHSPVDTTVSIFNGYKLRIRLFDVERLNDYDTAKNAVIMFLKYQNGKSFVLFIDSTFCNNATVKFKDFNNDGVKDVLIFYDYDVRSNEMYHLYLVNPIAKKLIKIKNFEGVKNPDFNSAKDIIESHVVSGKNYWTYYKINKANKLINYKKIIYD